MHAHAALVARWITSRRVRFFFLFKMKSGEKEKEGQLGTWIDQKSKII
jgi:hypothetical protein